MEEIVSALSASIAQAGPTWAGVICICTLLTYIAVKLVPLYASHEDKRLDIEREREARKAKDAERRDVYERDRAKLEGRWLEQYERATTVQEQTNADMGDVAAQMTVLNATLADSKTRSREMASEVHEIHAATVLK